MTRVNFKALDQYSIKPVGVYGSKKEIVRFLSHVRVIDDAIAALLLDDTTESRTKPTLRSGLYILRPAEQMNMTEQIFFIYWPERNTWDDSASHTASRNRATFMRYLTKMCDQVVALISPEHAQSIVWKDVDERKDINPMYFKTFGSRIINCVVDRTDEQEESVKIREGFEAHSEHIALPESSPESPVPKAYKPYLLFGETTQGILTSKYQPGRRLTNFASLGEFSDVRLKQRLTTSRLELSGSLDATSLEILARVGLKERFREQCDTWERKSQELSASRKKRLAMGLVQMKKQLKENLEALKCTIHKAVVDEVVILYPCFKPESFPYTDEHPAGIQESFQSIVSLCPNVGHELKEHIKKKCFRITDEDFRALKKSICLFAELYSRTADLESQIRDQLLSTVLEGGFQSAKIFLDDILQGSGSSGKAQGLLKPATHTVLPLTNPFKEKDNDSIIAYVQGALEDANRAARNIDDRTFLLHTVNSEAVQSTVVRSMAENAQRSAESYLKTNISAVAHKLGELVSRKQEHDRRSKLENEIERYYEGEQRVLRSHLIAYINGQSHEIGYKHIIHINSVKEIKSKWNPRYQIEGSEATEEDPMMVFTVYPMRLSEQDSQSLKLNPHTIMTPHFHRPCSFQLPLGFSIMYVLSNTLAIVYH
ncbi:hypothetical protein ID866_10283 [Astraeus odoratus]|nr:hypothetical protein ID866_10283 [Astraeus odoratus]